MADPSEPDAGDATDAAEPDAATRSPRGGFRSLDRRTVAICLVLGVVAALLTVLVASALGSDDDSSKQAMELRETDDGDRGDLLTQPLATVDGQETDLAALQEDQPMLVNLWQSACIPCVEEMPMLSDAQADNPGITFIGVATLDDLAKAKRLAEQTGITYPWVVDPTGELYYAAKAAGMPTTVLLDADGSVIDTHTNRFTDRSELQAFIDQAG